MPPFNKTGPHAPTYQAHAPTKIRANTVAHSRSTADTPAATPRGRGVNKAQVEMGAGELELLNHRTKVQDRLKASRKDGRCGVLDQPEIRREQDRAWQLNFQVSLWRPV